MEVIAHRGFAAEGVENALSTLVAAVPRADAVEFDVRLSRDGEPVVFHDRRVDRLTDFEGAVDTYDVGELTAMNLAGTDETIPRLATVLERLRGPIVPELKTAETSERLLSLLGGYADALLVSSFRTGTLRAIPSRFDRAVICAPAAWGDELPSDVPLGIEEGLAAARDLDAAAIHPYHELCTTEAVERARSAGLLVNAWTARSPAVGTAMHEAGVDGAITDSPDYVDR